MQPIHRKLLGLFLLIAFALCAYGNKYEVDFQGHFLYIDGEKYIRTDGLYEESNIRIGKTSNKHIIYEVVGDEEHNYVVSRSFLDQRLFVKESYVPDRTTISAVCFGASKNGYIFDNKIIDCVLALESNKEFADDNDEFWESRSMGKNIYFKYGDEAVGVCIGEVFLYNGQYMYYSYNKRKVTVLTDDQLKLLQAYL